MSEVLYVALTDIEAPEAWNARSGAWFEDVADPSSDDGGYEMLRESMAKSKKNDAPVLLRPSLTGNRYVLVDGFRRYRAAKELQFPGLFALVEDMSEFEARRRNILAATGSQRFRTPDLAWAIDDLKRLGGPKLTDDDIAKQVALSPSYVNILRRIMRDVDPRVTQAWRASSVKVELPELQRLTTLPKEKHWAEWEEIVLEKQTRPKGTRMAAQLRIEGKCRELAKTIGQLERAGVTTRNPTSWVRAVGLITRRELTAEQMQRLEKIMNEGYLEGLKEE